MITHQCYGNLTVRKLHCFCKIFSDRLVLKLSIPPSTAEVPDPVRNYAENQLPKTMARFSPGFHCDIVLQLLLANIRPIRGSEIVFEIIVGPGTGRLYRRAETLEKISMNCDNPETFPEAPMILGHNLMASSNELVPRYMRRLSRVGHRVDLEERLLIA